MSNESAAPLTQEEINSRATGDKYHTFKELYRERTALGALIARYVPGVQAFLEHDEQPGFDGCRTVLRLNLFENGQVSWHVADEDCDLLVDIPVHRGPSEYDGHSTPEKYARVEATAKGQMRAPQ